jgi:glycosyltransferase involved in cell wall biosynthesis
VSEPRVLVVHNRYRLHGGEERAVDLQLAAFERAGIEHEALFRDSGEAGPARAARAMLGGGERPEEVAAAVRGLRATVVHVHNMNPLFGPRSLAAAREAGARVVLHLHNFRLFCAIAVCFRDGETCFRCRGRFTLPGAVLNCRGSVPESAVYTAALARHQPAVFEAVDRFVTPSAFAAGQLRRLGVPGERLSVLGNYLPRDDFATSTSAGEGGYALAVGRLSAEKGFAYAVRASALSRVPLLIAGDGPLLDELRALVSETGAPVELLGRVSPERVRELLRGAAMAVVPSVGPDVMPFAALEAMAAGVPVVAARSGSLPELVGPERCVRRSDPEALAAAMRGLWEDAGRRAAEGEAALARARERFGEDRYLRELLEIYAADVTYLGRSQVSDTSG